MGLNAKCPEGSRWGPFLSVLSGLVPSYLRVWSRSSSRLSVSEWQSLSECLSASFHVPIFPCSFYEFFGGLWDRGLSRAWRVVFSFVVDFGRTHFFKVQGYEPGMVSANSSTFARSKSSCIRTTVIPRPPSFLSDPTRRIEGKIFALFMLWKIVFRLHFVRSLWRRYTFRLRVLDPLRCVYLVDWCGDDRIQMPPVRVLAAALRMVESVWTDSVPGATKSRCTKSRNLVVERSLH